MEVRVFHKDCGNDLGNGFLAKPMPVHFVNGLPQDSARRTRGVVDRWNLLNVQQRPNVHWHMRPQNRHRNRAQIFTIHDSLMIQKAWKAELRMCG